jgi:hypothetical protein
MILVGEQHQLVARVAGGAARVVQQHQRQQPLHLRLVWHQPCERLPEADRLGRELATAAVALVEDQVDDCEHRREPVGQ